MVRIFMRRAFAAKIEFHHSIAVYSKMSTIRPGDFSFLKNAWTEEMLADAYQAITSTNMWDFMRSEEPPKEGGYAWWNHPNLTKINAAMKYEGHSGASHAITLRMMQSLSKIGWDAWVNEQQVAARPLQ